MGDNSTRAAQLQAGFLYFWVYAALGWVYEVFLEVVVYRWGFSNRGFLFGPYLPVYGVGALLILAFLRGLSRREWRVGRVNLMPVVVFVSVVVLTTVVELIASYLLEWTTGGWLWDYTRYTIQWQGRICLSASLRFGVGGMIVLYGLQPLLEKGMARLGDKRKPVFWVLFVLFAIDCISRIVR
ncbi:MAG TPA: putative ABC transporter permease [Candidatus Agathobaculum merdavium]|nr:putative ABC transporter permease [Candidatus Agathobaculum merdavium]